MIFPIPYIRLWLRWFTQIGELIPVPTESAMSNDKSLRAYAAKQETALAKKRAEQLAERLRQLGVNPDELDYSYFHVNRPHCRGTTLLCPY